MFKRLTKFQERVFASMKKQGIIAASYDGKTWFDHCPKHRRRFQKFSGVQQSGPNNYGLVRIQICPKCTEGKMRIAGLFATSRTSFHLAER